MLFLIHQLFGCEIIIFLALTRSSLYMLWITFVWLGLADEIIASRYRSSKHSRSSGRETAKRFVTRGELMRSVALKSCSLWYNMSDAWKLTSRLAREADLESLRKQMCLPFPHRSALYRIDARNKHSKVYKSVSLEPSWKNT